ncbi:hypothetical protein WJX77_004348 [Trebouxia sp. C0004]
MARASGIFSVTRLMEIEVWQRELDKMLQRERQMQQSRRGSSSALPDAAHRIHMGKALRACVGHQALDAILTQKASRKAGLGEASISAGSIHCLGLAASSPGSQPGPGDIAAGCGNATKLPPGGIPARDQSISTTDPGSTAEVKGICTEDQSIPGKASASPMEGQGVLLTQPAAVDRVLSAIGDDSSVAAGVEAHAGGVSASSAGQGIADELSLVSYRPTHMSIQASPHGHKISSKWHCAGALGGAIPDAVTQHTAPESACATSKVLQQASALEHTLSSKICKKQDTPASGADSSLLTPTSPRCLLAKAAARMQAERADAHSPLTIATDS